jgi:uncharacterized SAM-binding protein YcdF (DUF218 family)
MTSLESILFFSKKLITMLLLPPLSALVLIALGLCLARRRRVGRVLAWSGLALVVLLSTPQVVAWLAAPLQAIPHVDLAAAREAQAIVILGGGRYVAAPEYGGASAGRMVLERLRYGARLARQTGLPVLVSGGAPNGEGPAEARLMRDVLVEDFKIPVRWVEDQSLDTRDNAVMSARTLSGESIRRVLVVTHAFHMRRALNEFTAAGLTAIPAPTGYYEVPGDEPGIKSWLPNGMGAQFGSMICHEWLGLLAQRLRRSAAPGSAVK